VSGRDRKEITIRLPRPRIPRPRRPRSRRAVIIAGVAVLAIAGFGTWWFAIRDTGPTKAEVEAKEKAEAAAKAAVDAQAELAACQSQVGPLLTAEQDLEGRLNAVGLSYNDYGNKVGDVSVAYNTIPFKELSPQCLTQVGVHAEKAMNSYVKAGQTWTDCFDDFSCDDDSIDPDLQLDWFEASAQIKQASQGMTAIGQP
jgi:hypothetical protein